MWHFELWTQDQADRHPSQRVDRIPGGAEQLPVGAKPRAWLDTAHPYHTPGSGPVHVLPALSDTERNIISSSKLASTVPSCP